MKVLFWIVGVGVALLLAVALLVTVSASMSLDDSYMHTEATEQLPSLDELSDGIVLIKAGEYHFRARVAGMDKATSDAATVILLHGFPVTSAMWIPLITPLEEAGFRVVAFDQRGYSPGARPGEVDAYTIQNLVGDVFAVADAVGAHQFHLVGHDWGSAVGWSAVMANPSRILTWTGLSIAHPVAFGEALQTDPDQQARSRYFALFTAPRLPEALFSFNNQSLLMAMYGDMREDQKAEYRAVFSERGALTSALNWYRMMAASLSGPRNNPDISVPTLFIWGNNDASAGRVAVAGQVRFMKGPYEEVELDGDHWLVTSHADVIVPKLLAHLGSHP